MTTSAQLLSLLLLFLTTSSNLGRSEAFITCGSSNSLLRQYGLAHSLRRRRLCMQNNRKSNDCSDREIAPNCFCKLPSTSIPRRRSLHQLLFSFSGLSLLSVASPPPGNAACLPGDLSPDCIGVYKVPVDDRIGNYVDTPEKLKAYAPDVRWVPQAEYPKTYSEAASKLRKSRDRCANLVELVRTGKLEEAGIELLDITPTVTVAGRVVVGELSGAPRKTNDWTAGRNFTASSVTESGGLNDAISAAPNGGKEATGYNGDKSNSLSNRDLTMRGYRAEIALSELVVALGQCDILLGQGMRGQLGAPAPAQIQILQSVKEINGMFDELINTLPEKIKG